MRIKEEGTIDIKYEEEIENKIILKKDVPPIIGTAMAFQVHHHEPEIIKQSTNIKIGPDYSENNVNPIY